VAEVARKRIQMGGLVTPFYAALVDRLVQTKQRSCDQQVRSPMAEALVVQVIAAHPSRIKRGRLPAAFIGPLIRLRQRR